ncbi:hypothetical protein BS50DRAFT_571614 [Corynespora cassiicola Philippines]|uniref:CENP-T/Histone H4 histone fold domain-containing protein n=1 Tax=Corynespora cassiicola Philippines TaxID=1448308 RepID=A0A2T2NY55_CORCC|nr:hypothetical protein BS50DRAFT_571614 [Corynespora cassiicola Philippines]
MSASARKKQRVSPPSSAAATPNDATLHTDLHRLASVAPKPVTPFRRATSAGPTPNSRRTPNITIRTPGTARTPRGGPATRPISTRRVAPTTPHAIRALRERANAGRTPGFNRRRSGRIQRETPRDILRDLSRALARDTEPVEPSPQVPVRPPRHSAFDLLDEEDGPDPAAPRLSMPLEDMYDDDDDDLHDIPPRQSLLPNLPDDADNGTIQSLEFGRRALSEDPRTMFPGRLSERFGDLSDLGMDGEEYDVDGPFINRRPTLGPDELLTIGEEPDDTSSELRALTGRRDGRPSDVDLGVFGELDEEPDEPTFRFTIPQRMHNPVQEDAEDGTRPLEDLLEQFEGQGLDEDDLEEDAVLDAEFEAAEQTAKIVDEATGGLDVASWEDVPDVDMNNTDADLQAYREEASAVDRSLQTEEGSPDRTTLTTPQPRRQRRELKISRHGHEYPSFPIAVVKRLATGFAKSQGANAKMSKDTFAALSQASDWFFEEMGADLAAYAQHAGRKQIEESDVIALMKRQRQVSSSATVFSLAQKMLPRELLQELRMEPTPKLRGVKRKRLETIEEEDEG